MVKTTPVSRIDIEALKHPIVAGGRYKLNAVARSSNGDPRAGAVIDWTSDNPRIATVDAAGVVTGNRAR